MRLGWMALIVLALAACETKPYEDMTLPDGSQGKLVSCVNNISICYRLAIQACAGSYKIIDKTQTLISNIAYDWPRDWVGQGVPSHHYMTQHNLAIRCLSPPKTIPRKLKKDLKR